MRLTRLGTSHFRNLAPLQLAFADGSHFFLGPNGQGKTNLLEAIGLLTAVRSFRVNDLRSLPRWAQKEPARLHFQLAHPMEGETEVELHLGAGEKGLWVDGERVARLTDYVGRFPVVVLSSQDIQLLRGSPQGRRRFLDLTLAVTTPGYLGHLQGYQQALSARNALLRHRAGEAQLTAFAEPLIRHGVALHQARVAGVATLRAAIQQLWSSLTKTPEKPDLVYQGQAVWAEAASAQATLTAYLTRDREQQTTTSGPHRDDVALRLLDHAAKTYASEGQQRSLVLALRLAQARLFAQSRQVAPLLLADDVLNELDPQRRAGFWRAVDPAWQVFATGTTAPDPRPGQPWQIWDVAAGEVAAR